ncbi:MAG: hypothetical protein ACYTGV_10880 [Planctomycetota bacterium]
MSTRALGLLALLLALLLAGVACLGLDRMGFLRPPEAPEWVFENALIQVDPGTVVRMRPVHEDAGEFRWLFGSVVTEPVVDPDLPPDPKTGPPAQPHVRVVVGSRRPDEPDFVAAHMTYPLLSLMGARTPLEWLEGIRLVSDRRLDGSRKPMLQAAYGHQNGSAVMYFFDPADPAPQARGLGWTRMEVYQQGKLSEIIFSHPDGHIRSK